MTQCIMCNKDFLNSSLTDQHCPQCLVAKEWDGEGMDSIGEIIHWHWCDIVNDRNPSDPALIAQVKSSLKQDLNNKLQTDKSWLNQFITLAQSFVIDGGCASQEKVHERLQQTKNLLAHCREKEDAKAIRTSSELLRLINWLEIEWLN